MKVLIVGGGVIGLTTAWTLLDKGYDVDVLAKEYVGGMKTLTSEIAGALWEWPHAVCGGKPTSEMALKDLKAWCIVSYERFKKIAADSFFQEMGVTMRKSNFFFFENVEETDFQHQKMLDIEKHLDGFRRDENIVFDLGLNPQYGIKDVYQHLAPIIDTPAYMKFLTKYLSTRCNLYVGAVDNVLLQEKVLRHQFSADVVVNCTGLSSLLVAEDPSVYPLRGALLRVINDGSMFPIINESMAVSLDGREGANDMVYIVPRSQGIVLLGGFAEPNEWSTDISLNYGPVRDMFKRCTELYPPFKYAQLDKSYPLAVGLRPLRLEKVRVEREPNTRIIHNYGQGGSGYSLSFGCAETVAELINAINIEEEDCYREEPMSVYEMLPVTKLEVV